MPGYAYAILAFGWLGWIAPFLLALRRPRSNPQQVDHRARWGILFLVVAYSLIWQAHFWTRTLPPWRLAFSVLFLLIANALSWSSARSLGRQWRIEAGLNPDHELVVSGPYRIVRHPIYASMLCIFCATAFVVTPLPLFLVALLFFIVGTEIRVRVEDGLLAGRFGEQFTTYKNTVPAYIPFVR